MPVVWPLVGRREELELIEQVLSRPDAAGMVLAGEAGVGKTRLAREAVVLAERRDMPTAWAAATEAGRSIPFGTMAHLFARPLAPAMNPQDVIRDATAALLERSDNRRPVIGVDDAHLLDDHSAVLLHDLAQGNSALLVATVRTGEATPDPITSLWKDGLCERVEVQVLSETEVEELLEEALGGQVDGASAHRLWEQSGGNPLFLREIVLGGIDFGTISETGGVWRWKGHLETSPRLKDVMGGRLGRLSAQEREALELVAVGEPIGVRLLESIASDTDVVSLERAGLLTESQDGRRVEARIVHPLYAETLRGTVPPARKRAIAKQLADATEAAGARRRGDLLRLATWTLEAGRRGTPDLLLPAAAQAFGLCDFRFAEHLAKAAVEAGGDPDASVLLAQSWMGQGRFDEAEELLARLQDSAASEDEVARTASIRAQNLHWNLGRFDAAVDLLRVAETAVSNVDLRDEMAVARAYLLFTTGRTSEAIALGRPILQRPTLPDRAIVNALGAVGQALQWFGRPEESMQYWDRWKDRVLENLAGVPYAPIAPTVYPFWGAYWAGRFHDAEAIARQGYREALGQEAEWARGFIASLVGIAARARGRVRVAAKWSREAIVPFRESNTLGMLSPLLGELAHALALSGDAVAARSTLVEAESGAVLGVVSLNDFSVRVARPWVLLAQGEVSRAVEVAVGDAKALGSMGFRASQATVLHDVARMGEPKQVVEELTRLVEVCDGRLFPAFARHTQALVSNDASSLEQISVEFEDMGADLLAAEAAAEASRVYREEGKTGSAYAAAGRARDLAARCEGARTPALEGIDVPLPLTKREREVATLAARGLSNPEIARKLVVSVRTVENQLHRLYAKLGVNRREDLPAILGQSSTADSD